MRVSGDRFRSEPTPGPSPASFNGVCGLIALVRFFPRFRAMRTKMKRRRCGAKGERAARRLDALVPGDSLPGVMVFHNCRVG